MSNNTKISWTSISWNIMTGCTPISDGCNDCYAKAMVKRLQAMTSEVSERFYSDHTSRVYERTLLVERQQACVRGKYG